MNAELPPSVLRDANDHPHSGGFIFSEASQFIEFCVDLDSQADRMSAPCDPRYTPEIDPALWNPEPVYDSRKAVARDVVAFTREGRTEADQGWVKLYADIVSRASQNPPAQWTAEALACDPRYNGFGPYQSAWLLYEGRNENAGAYAVAIRGTVFSARPSVIEDALFYPVIAEHFLSRAVSFSSFSGASLHSGFAHATFSLLLDDRYGILRILRDQPIAANARLFIVGHSQGAAMATLTHAFLYYALKQATASHDPFDLHGKRYALKSYEYAQPKPGNSIFSADFAGITQAPDNAIVINNAIDPVPQVPLTLQAVGDVIGDLPGSSLPIKVLRYAAGIGSTIRGIASRIAEPFVRKDDAGFGYYYNYARLAPIGRDKTGPSWNFTAAGRVLLVYGTPGDPTDSLLQHHAWTYRNLIRSQLRSPLAT